MANKPTPADFSPTVPDFPNIGTYQPVYGKFDLTTYIQGASDYEIMSFLVQCYNATLKGYSDVTQLSKDTVTAYNQLQTWVNTWFANLDVQNDINAKLEQMRTTGELASVIASSEAMIPSIDNYFASQVGNATLYNETSKKIDEMASDGALTRVVKETGQISPAVTEYLNTAEGTQNLSNVTAQKIDSMAQNGSLGDVIKQTNTIPVAVKQYLDSVDGTDNLSKVTAKKIEEMAANGELGTVISRTTDLQKTTTDWLTANVTPVGSAVVVNKSLSIEGAAADAKTVGKHITPFVFGASEDCNFQAFISGNKCYFNWASGNSVYAREKFYNRENLNRTQIEVKDYTTDPGGGTYFVYLNENEMKSANILNYTYTPGDNILAILHFSGTKTQDIGYLPYTHKDVTGANLSTFFGSVNEFVAIGDSLTVGYTSKKDGTIIRKDYSHSWPHYIEKMFGCKAYWSAHSGITSKAWLEGVNNGEQIPEGKDYLVSLGAKSLYFIALITNDSVALTLGQPSDIGTSNDTFYRYYAEIITTIKTVSPNAIIVCTGSPLGDSSTNITNFENAIKYIVNQNTNTYYLDARLSIAKIPDGLKYAYHWSTPGYAMLANIYANLIDNLIASNPYAFINIADAELKTNPD